jgi:hypothetical protein
VDVLAEEEFITNLPYSDDILLPQIKRMVADLDQEAAKVGLKLHPGKTKIQHNNVGYGVGVKSAKCGNVMVEVLATGDQTTYLGRSINLTDMDDTELQSRIAKAWAKFGVFRSELTDRAIPMHLRTRLFDAVITPTILYGSETWTMTLQRQLSLRAVQRRMMRRIIHAHRSYDKYDSYVDWIKEETAKAVQTMADHNIICWTVLQRRKAWKWAGKMANKSNDRWNHAVNAWHLHDIRPRGRPKARWQDVLNRFLTQKLDRDHINDDWMKAAADRKSWQNMARDFEEVTSLDKQPDEDE